MSRSLIPLACIVSLSLPNAAFGESSPSPNAANASPGPVAAAPQPGPTPSTPPAYVRFLDAELLLGGRVANAEAPNRTGRVTNSLRAAAEYKFLGRNFAEIEYRRWDVNHPDGFVTSPGPPTVRFVPARHFTESDILINSSLYGIGHTYLATSTFIHSNNEGDPTVHSDLGFGIERLPDPTRTASLFGSYYYYPEVSGKLTLPDGSRSNLRYKLQTFRLGGSLEIPDTHLFLTANFIADHYLRKQNAPANETHTGASLGIGYRL